MSLSTLSASVNFVKSEYIVGSYVVTALVLRLRGSLLSVVLSPTDVRSLVGSASTGFLQSIAKKVAKSKMRDENTSDAISRSEMYDYFLVHA